jgi:glycosyltransferase involved in cell wall biosynthesis
MTTRSPKVSIVLPVYNEAAFLSSTLDSLLGQTFKDFEIIVSDNASTDDTSRICFERAEQDARVRYYRNETNVGSIRNFRLAIQKCRGEYFFFAAGHDRWAPDFIEACLRPLEQNPEVVLAYPTSRWLEEGDCVGEVIDVPLDTRSLTKSRGFHKVIQKIHSYAIYGVFRRAAFEKIPPMPNGFAPDQLTLAELSLIGPFAFVPETEFYLRRTYDISHLQRHLRKLNLHLGPKSSFALCANLFRNYFAIIDRHISSQWLRSWLKGYSAYVLLKRWHRLLTFILLAGWAPYWTNRLFRALGRPEPLDAPEKVGR